MVSIIAIIAIVVVTGGGLLLFSGRAGSAPSASPPSASEQNASSRTDIINKLRQLSITPKPVKLSKDAMCYAKATPLEREEYVCPRCGEKTLYSEIGSLGTRDAITAIREDIPTCRKVIGGIADASIELDESQFCKKCNPSVKNPQLGLKVTYQNGAPHRTWGISSNDCRILGEFFSGASKHKSGMDRETPLQDYIPRLEELLGVSLKEKSK